MAYAVLTFWHTKYTYGFARPVTGIQQGNSDGNPDTVGDPQPWLPLGILGLSIGRNFTPPFPAYLSGHATFRCRPVPDIDRLRWHSPGLLQPHAPTSSPVWSATIPASARRPRGNGQSRIYRAIHWQFDTRHPIAAGNAIGNCVSHYVLN